MKNKSVVPKLTSRARSFSNFPLGKGLRKNKKGIFFTLGLMFLSFVVLTIAILIFRNAQEYEGIVARLAVIDRVYELDTSIQRSVGDIFELKSGITVNITGSSISFEETLPNNKVSALNSSLQSFKKFIEGNLSNVNLTITKIDELPLKVFPNIGVSSDYIEYKHKSGSNWSDIEVLTLGITPDGYSIYIVTDKNVSCDPDFDNGGINMDISLEVIGNPEGCSYSWVNIEDIDIDIESDGSDFIDIAIGDTGELSIDLIQDSPISIRTTIIKNMPKPGVVADSLNLELNFGDIGVYKQSYVRII